MIKKIISLSALSMFVFAFQVSAQTCLANADDTTPDEDFSTITTSTVLHTPTGLIWQRCAVGQTFDGTTCTGEAEQMTWQEALAYAYEYDADLLQGWRVPNLKELASLAERDCVRPAINSTFFPVTPPDSFWTSTPSIMDPLRAWTVAFFNASHSIKEKDRTVYLRLVRTKLPTE